jgi:hypothetical protein
VLTVLFHSDHRAGWLDFFFDEESGRPARNVAVFSSKKQYLSMVLRKIIEESQM